MMFFDVVDSMLLGLGIETPTLYAEASTMTVRPHVPPPAGQHCKQILLDDGEGGSTTLPTVPLEAAPKARELRYINEGRSLADELTDAIIAEEHDALHDDHVTTTGVDDFEAFDRVADEAVAWALDGPSFR